MTGRGRRGAVGVVDLARELGVSTATVSRALNGSGAVRPELAARIRAHAEARGYVPNRLARALASTTSDAFVGFVVPYVDTLAYSAVAAECAGVLADRGTQMILTITGDDPRRELDQLRELAASRISGLVISATTGMLDASRELLATMPVVELHRAGGLQAPGVFSDDEQAVVDTVAHLAALGHTDIAFLGTPVALSNGAARLRGWRRGLAAAGLEPAPSRTLLLAPTRDNGTLGVARLLDGPGPPPTALIVASGSLSVAAATAVLARGCRVPDDLSLVVYGDPEWFALADPPLTTIAVDYGGLARQVARLLLDLLDPPAAGPPGPGPVLVAPRLHPGGSTAPPSGVPEHQTDRRQERT
ncbi:LacI family DNA-binding transcriptional regulator [Pseudonocardia benzenivorans]|uniref:Transcriptional regulator, LacI family n=2 Tax=Pseudonocardia TaxID=1847 RepID=F4CY43_PSEUX|nr:LacI family DNA-binding transcriptional regulator [Pseudonocardia dioxanivorans]AEA24284.1 transcriptional regulator, LacI family [Pseudonocardia dioxanivorans CB1190]GJF07247.1 LacI family transcriptional regulator [Pseudonocardia sp. D17]